jgi:hypothetical protein
MPAPKPLKLDDIVGKTWRDVVRHYKPEATSEEADYILWERTCFPSCNETTLKQLNTIFNAK